MKKLISLLIIITNCSIWLIGQQNIKEVSAEMTMAMNLDTMKTLQTTTLSEAELRAAIDGNTRKRKADKLYQRLGYRTALDRFRRLEKKGDLDPVMLAKMATAYRLNNQNFDAEYCYSKFVNQNTAPEHILHFAQTLQTNGKCEDARKWYTTYNSKVKIEDRVGVEYVENCSELAEFLETEDAKINNIQMMNSDDLDYVAMPYKDGLVFTSTRGIVRSVSKHKDKWTKGNFADLFYTKKTEEGGYTTPVEFNKNLNRKFHDGVASFVFDKIYFSRNNTSGKRKDGMIDLKIYEAQIDTDGQWIDSKELPFNNDEYTSCHPSVTSNDKWLFFASDRPGGYGGMDIYVSENVGGSWQQAINLGPMINTAANELFPFISEEGVLYFASNGHKGLGGLDIFAAKKDNQKGAAEWTERVNVGKPFNTIQDDFGFNIDQAKTNGFMTSARVGGLGKDDIYEWNTTEPFDPFKTSAKTVDMYVLDKDDKKRLEDVNINITAIGLNEADYLSDKNGEVEHTFTADTQYKIIAKKEGYEDLVKTVNAADLFEMKEALVVEMKKISNSKMNGKVLDSKTNKPLANATIALINKCTNKEETLKTNNKGIFTSQLKCDCDYEVVASKNQYNNQTKKFNQIRTACNSGTDVTAEFALTAIKKVITRPVPVAPSRPTRTVSKGEVIILPNVYYDYNKFNIRSKDAEGDLNMVVDWMQQYPSMEIELGSHTDSRGSDVYNQTLSQKRATSAVEYMIKRGISPNRIKAKGYGENNLINNCSNGVECTDDEHERNRRTEIRITRLDAPNVQVYQN